MRGGDWLRIAGGALAACLLAALISTRLAAPARAPQGRVTRVVSLSPAITETIALLGAGDRLVGRSDYCPEVTAAPGLPRVGTSLRPNLEAIARLRPDLVLGERNAQSPGAELSALAPLELLPWLTLEDLTVSVRRLGVLVQREEAADELATRLRAALAVSAPPGAPRVLLALAQPPGKLSQCWFIRRGSLHGAALRAAGGRNAVEDDGAGPPVLSLEEVLRLDPDAVVLLSPTPLSAEERAQLLRDWEGLPGLRAAGTRRVLPLVDPAGLVPGPRLLELIEPLRAAIAAVGS
ncbi:MAG: ABC transporter substrate-binding protein [Planctomycetota bacterium]